ncbi:MAG: 50S ribosomal protein L18 [Actinobacteria bacterium]|nr:50S ribosomal protein L18 [Actinomycetota bacterium]
MKTKNERKSIELKRKARTRQKIRKVSDRPRLCVFRSNRYIYGQIIDESNGRTILGISSRIMERKDSDRGKIDISFRTGEALAKKALDNKIESVVFDRSGYKYHGRVKALAEGARKGGLKF